MNKEKSEMNMEKRICLSICQMQKLKDLGVDIKDASLCWVRDPEGNYSLSLHDEYCYEMAFMNPVPAFTLQDILKLMPKRFQYKMDGNCGRYCDLEIRKLFSGWNLMYADAEHNLACFNRAGTFLLDTTFDMFVLLAENGHLEEEKNNE